MTPVGLFMPVFDELFLSVRTGVKLTKEAMQVLETQLQRLSHLDKWFVDIGYPSPALRES